MLNAKATDFQPLFLCGSIHTCKSKKQAARCICVIVILGVVSKCSVLPAYGYLVGLLFGVAPQRCP